MQRDARTSNQRHSTNPEPRAMWGSSFMRRNQVAGPAASRRTAPATIRRQPPSARRFLVTRVTASPRRPRRLDIASTSEPSPPAPFPSHASDSRRLEALAAPRSARPPQVAQLPAPSRGAPPRGPHSPPETPHAIGPAPPTIRARYQPARPRLEATERPENPTSTPSGRFFSRAEKPP